MSDSKPFGIDLASLKAKPKQVTQERAANVDRVAAAHGFVQREAGGRRGRPGSPRTGQVHAKVMPEVAEQIAAEARSRGVTQGVLIEEAWALYIENKPY